MSCYLLAVEKITVTMESPLSELIERFLAVLWVCRVKKEWAFRPETTTVVSALNEEGVSLDAIFV